MLEYWYVAGAAAGCRRRSARREGDHCLCTLLAHVLCVWCGCSLPVGIHVACSGLASRRGTAGSISESANNDQDTHDLFLCSLPKRVVGARLIAIETSLAGHISPAAQSSYPSPRVMTVRAFINTCGIQVSRAAATHGVGPSVRPSKGSLWHQVRDRRTRSAASVSHVFASLVLALVMRV